MEIFLTLMNTDSISRDTCGTEHVPLIHELIFGFHGWGSILKADSILRDTDSISRDTDFTSSTYDSTYTGTHSSYTHTEMTRLSQPCDKVVTTMSTLTRL